MLSTVARIAGSFPRHRSAGSDDAERTKRERESRESREPREVDCDLSSACQKLLTAAHQFLDEQEAKLSV